MDFLRPNSKLDPQMHYKSLELWSLIFLLAVGHLSAINLARAGDWPGWRGPSRNGIVAEESGWDGTRWLNSKSDWTAQVGDGASSPIVFGGKVYTLGHQDGQNLVSCLSSETGQIHWRQIYKTPPYGRNAMGDEGIYSGPSSTPEFDPDTRLLYTLSADGDLHAWDSNSQGKEVWRRNLYDDYQMPQRAKVGRSGRRDYGYTSAPLVYREWLLVEVGGPTGTIVAFDKRTGQEAWKSEANSVAGHTGAMAFINVENVPCVACMNFDGLLVTRLDEPHAGKTVATYPWITDFANNIAGPAVRDGHVLITSEYNHRSMCKLKITLQGAIKVWESPVSSKACTPVIHDGKVYLAWSNVRSVDWESGIVDWEGPRIGDAGSCIITRDQKLIVWGDQGTLLLADISANHRDRYVELARLENLAANDVWPHHAVAQQRLFCRDRKGTLICFSLKPSSRQP